MKELERIEKLFKDLYNGNPWIDVQLKTTLTDLTNLEAAMQIAPNMNSIWQITFHIKEWRNTVLRRVKGEQVESPEDNYFREVSDNSQLAWKQLLDELEKSQQSWLDHLSGIPENDLQRIFDQNNMSYYDHIQGILQHDAYHMGQIVLLKKIIRSGIMNSKT